MAKVSFIKLTPIKSGEIKEVKFNDEVIQIHQYLPVKDKIALTERVLVQAFDDTNHYSLYRLNILFIIEVVRTYTNINITDKQLENLTNVYDLLTLNGIKDFVISNIPEDEYYGLYHKVCGEAENLEKYLNSFAGIMKTITSDYSATEMDVDKITSQLNDPEALKTVKEILDKIG